MGSRRGGRKRGSRNRGYFYRKGRGWCATDFTLLRFENGAPIREQHTPQALLQKAYVCYLADRDKPVDDRVAPAETVAEDVTVQEACGKYLNHAKASGAKSTYRQRADSLYDFCTGWPAAKRDKSEDGPPKPEAKTKTKRKSKPKPKAKAKDEPKRIHAGYGKMLVSDLKPYHIDEWLAAHRDWKGCRRTKVQAVKRALNYCAKEGFIKQNPIKGKTVARSNMRKTYITPEQEKACYRFAKPALSDAIKVCIRTGARYGCEFAKLTAKHVTLTAQGMEWRFSPEESKTGAQTKKERIIRVPNTEEKAREVIAIVERQMKLHPTGPLFRNSLGEPWTQTSLGEAFRRLRKRLAANGIELDDGACMYACRHTYAKRTLTGFWTGKPTTIEVLAGLMGNSREVCWAHYTDWCEVYTDPLWASA